MIACRSRSVGLALLVTALWAGASAQATTFILPTTIDLARASDVIVLGVVEEVRSLEGRGAMWTEVALRVEQAVKGPAVSRLTVVEPGGRSGGRGRWIHGVPTFAVGERVLVFLRRNGQRELHTTFLGVGKFSVVRGDSGADIALRDLGSAQVLGRSHGRLVTRRGVTRHDLGTFLRTLDGMGGASRPTSDAALQAASSAGRSPFQASFSFAGPPLVRWFLPDQGQPIPYQISYGGDYSLGEANSVAATEGALAAWSGTPCATIQLLDDGEGPASSFLECDGRNEITFNDPFNEIDDPINCSGVLAVGGVCANGGAPQTFNGMTAYPISEGDVVVNNGFGGCPFWSAQNLAELLTHELGHTIGLAHSSDDPAEGDPSLRDATMYYAAHFDGRGATLMRDDIAAVCALYPAGRTGSVTLRHMAIVADGVAPMRNDRLVVDGTLALDGGQLNPDADTLILDLRVSATSLFRLAVSPGQWFSNRAGTLFRYRQVTATGLTTVSLSARDPGALRFRIMARGLNLSAVQADPVILSIALGAANVTRPLPPLRVGSRGRVYP